MRYKYRASAVIIALGLLGFNMLAKDKKHPQDDDHTPKTEVKKVEEKKGDEDTYIQPASLPIEQKKEEKPKLVIDEGDQSSEERIQEGLRTDKQFSQIATVENVSCDKNACRIMAEAKDADDNSAIFMGVIEFLRAHPEYGSSFEKDDVADNPKAMLITISMDNQ